MKIKLLTAVLMLLTANSYAAKPTSTTFISQIERIQVNKTALDAKQQLIRAERFHFATQSSCGKSQASVNERSLGMDLEKYQRFLKEIVGQAKNDAYFLITTTPCDSKATDLITRIRPCKKGICPAKYLTNDNVIWLDNQLQPTNKKSAALFIEKPFPYDKKEKLWKITGWYANSVDEPENKSKIKAFETFTSDKNFSDQKFISNYVSYYRSGKTSSKVFYDREGILSGEANYWYESGQLKQHFVYVDGKIHGTFISYNSNGTVESKSEFIHGQHADGACNHYDENGNPTREHSYLNGKYDGKYVDYFPNGKIEREETYANGHTIGESKTYYDTGTLKYVFRYDSEGKEDGVRERYNKDGVLTSKETFVKGRQASRQSWFANGNKEYQEQWDDSGKKDGDYKTWAKNGELVAHIRYQHGEVVFDKTWTDKGKPIHSDSYKNGEQDGIAKRWDESTGQLIQETPYKADKIDGVVKEWDAETGKRISETSYKEGTPDGNRKMWDPKTGHLVQESTVKAENTALVLTKVYDKDSGKLTSESWNENDRAASRYIDGQPATKIYQDGKLIIIGCGYHTLRQPDETRNRAEQGDASAQVLLGKYYDSCKDFENANIWMKKAAEQNIVEAFIYLYSPQKDSEGKAIPRSKEQYRENVLKAAELGNNDAQYRAALLYLPTDACSQIFNTSCGANDEAPAPDIQKSLEWFGRAAESSNVNALIVLGIMYEKGIGVQKSVKKALSYYEIANKKVPGALDKDIARLKGKKATSKTTSK